MNVKDNLQFTEPKDCRYDTCLVVSDEFDVDNKYINLGKTIGGKYCVFKISHTVEFIELIELLVTYIMSILFSERNMLFL